LEQGCSKTKVILITGGGTGLGRAIGERFLGLGAKLAIAGRRAEVVAQTADELGALGELFFQATDVLRPNQVVYLLDAVAERFGRLDVLVNNAAGNFVSPTERLSYRHRLARHSVLHARAGQALDRSAPTRRGAEYCHYTTLRAARAM